MLRQRVDRTYQFGAYWIWAFPELNPDMGFSLVVHSGANSTACFNKGRNSFYAFGTTKALGYADPLLTNYLVHSAEQLALPYLLQQFSKRASKLVAGSTTDKLLGMKFSTIYDAELDLALLINDATSLPYAIRAKETHKIFGSSTSDIVFSNFTRVPFQGNSSIQLPHRVQTVYNQAFVLEDFTVDKYTLNPTVDADFYTAAPPADAESPVYMGPAPASQDDTVSSDIHEFYEAGLWGGVFEQRFNVSDVVAQPVFQNGSTKIQALFVGYPDYVQLLVELDNALIITDAPAHRSNIVIEWIAQNMKGKKVTHVVPSHHHRDHAGGVNDYLAAGATLVIPEVAKHFYENVNGGHFKVATYGKDKPFVLEDKQTRFESFWHEDSSHARDWTYTTAYTKCRGDKNDFVVYNVDVVNPGPGAALRTDIAHAREFLLSAIADGVPKKATLVGSHGSTGYGLGTQESLEYVADLAGMVYPDVKGRQHQC